LSEAQKFQEIVLALREDLSLVESLYWMLHEKLVNNPYLGGFYHEQTAFEIREWLYDVFLDKIYDIDSKILRFLKDLSAEEFHKKASIQQIEKYVNEIIYEKKGMGYGKTYQNLDYLKKAIANYRHSVDVLFDNLRKVMYKANWIFMQKINFEDYLFARKRRKYVTAREELGTAQQMTKNGKYEEVLNHIRPALELAIKERFGFAKFKNFWKFLIDADKLNFPLPAFDMLYFYYGEGSGRIHAGKLSNPFECKTALNFAEGFIERLELINISQQEIDNFKKNCKWVE
jgi:hypothetical protein